MDAGVLDKGSIMEHLDAPEPLVDCYLDLDVQLQANGFDLTVKEVLHLESAGEIGPGAGPASLPNPTLARLMPRCFLLAPTAIWT